ncbi:MAG TPA: glycosyltransferase family protein [Gemmatimonadales bacterium]|nr:glycosyltransferase family protein [Gemmatimonadales bacterium]
MNGDVVTVIQARTGSSRLPGKVLLPLHDTTILGRMLERVKASRLAGTVVVATTTDPADEEIVAIAGRAGVTCYQGHPTDLLDRHYAVGRMAGARHVVKIPSDCPLIDPAVIDRVLAYYLAHAHALDYVSNLHPATYPDGFDVEVMGVDALAAAWEEARKPYEREHTTPFIWNQPDRFRVENVVWETGEHCALSHRVVLDYIEDYEVIRRVDEALSGIRPRYTVRDVRRYLDLHPEVVALNERHRGVAWYQNHLDELPALRGREPEMAVAR